jgi:hypothetical protein
MNAPFLGHFEGHLRGVVICDNDPAEVDAIVGKGVIWLIALIGLLYPAFQCAAKQTPK